MRFLLLILLAVALAAVLAILTRSTAVPPVPAPAITVTAVRGLRDHAWTVTLSNGCIFQVELRALETGGTPPQVGRPIAQFRDQRWLPLLGPYGYATFAQGAITYHAYR